MHTAVELYKIYPRHLAPREAIRAIEKALQRLPLELRLNGIEIENFDEWMRERVCLFRESDAGKENGLFLGYKPPYPATWFNKTRYLDDPQEWFKNGTNFGDITARTAEEKKPDLYEQANPDCEKCAGIGYCGSETKPGTLEACPCTVAARGNRQFGSNDQVGSKRPTQSGFAEFKETSSRSMGAAANGRGAGKV